MKPYKKLLFISTAITIIILLLITSIDSKNQITIYQLETNKINTSLTIALVSDFHNNQYNKQDESVQELAQEILQEKPDLIILVGDLFQEETSNQKTLQLFQELQNHDYIYYVTGNHEYWSEKINDLDMLLKQYNIKRLQGNIATFSKDGNSIILSGLDDPEIGNTAYEKQYNNLKNNLNTKKYNILLAHRPERLPEYLDLGVDLTLSGHAHGGQIRIPFLLKEGLIAPNQGLFPQRTGGIYYDEKMIHIVSKGLGDSLPLPRLFNSKELVIIKINQSVN